MNQSSNQQQKKQQVEEKVFKFLECRDIKNKVEISVKESALTDVQLKYLLGHLISDFNKYPQKTKNKFVVMLFTGIINKNNEEFDELLNSL